MWRSVGCTANRFGSVQEHHRLILNLRVFANACYRHATDCTFQGPDAKRKDWTGYRSVIALNVRDGEPGLGYDSSTKPYSSHFPTEVVPNRCDRAIP